MNEQLLPGDGDEMTRDETAAAWIELMLDGGTGGQCVRADIHDLDGLLLRAGIPIPSLKRHHHDAFIR